MDPWMILFLGFLLVLAGAVLPFLMVIHLLKSTFFLNFFSYTASLVGIILGLIGSAMYVRLKKK